MKALIAICLVVSVGVLVLGAVTLLALALDKGADMTGQELGVMGELYVARQLRAVGLDVQRSGPADLVADGLAVEVKAARAKPYKRGRKGYQYCLHKPGHTDHRRAAVVILLAYWDSTSDPVAFVIPSERLGNRRKLTIPNRQPWLYAGKWARYYRRWDVLADVMEGAGDG